MEIKPVAPRFLTPLNPHASFEIHLSIQEIS